MCLIHSQTRGKHGQRHRNVLTADLPAALQWGFGTASVGRREQHNIPPTVRLKLVIWQKWLLYMEALQEADIHTAAAAAARV